MRAILLVINERDDAQQTLRQVRDMLTDLELYLLSSKFQGPDNDYAHVRTDMLPKIAEIRFAAIG